MASMNDFQGFPTKCEHCGKAMRALMESKKIFVNGEFRGLAGRHIPKVFCSSDCQTRNEVGKRFVKQVDPTNYPKTNLGYYPKFKE